MYEERSYFLVQQYKKLKHWASDNDFALEYTDAMINRHKKEVEDPCSRARAQLADDVDREIQHCINEQMPFILLVKYVLKNFKNLKIIYKMNLVTLRARYIFFE